MPPYSVPCAPPPALPAPPHTVVRRAARSKCPLRLAPGRAHVLPAECRRTAGAASYWPALVLSYRVRRTGRSLSRAEALGRPMPYPLELPAPPRAAPPYCAHREPRHGVLRLLPCAAVLRVPRCACPSRTACAAPVLRLALPTPPRAAVLTRAVPAVRRPRTLAPTVHRGPTYCLLLLRATCCVRRLPVAES
ncbi:hypothetical protein [Kribbella sp. NPDC000426]|uniref:hypothetical protein n=1 Tax=Kribbella sp. NPDC000426 TaxID=3154255 RepID=UPI00331CDEB2